MVTHGRAVEDFTAGRLAMAAELAGPLLPHGHGQAPASFSPGHERARGIEWRNIAETVRLLKRESRSATVDQHALPVQIRPSPSPVGGKTDRKPRLAQRNNTPTLQSSSIIKTTCLLTLFSLLSSYFTEV